MSSVKIRKSILRRVKRHDCQVDERLDAGNGKRIDSFSADFIERYRAGNPEAEVLLWTHMREQHLPLLCSLGFSYEDAEDICFEVHCCLLKTRCRTYDPTKAPFTAWLRTVIKNAAKYELRKRRRLGCTPLSDCDALFAPFARAEKESGKSDLIELVKRARGLLGQSHQFIISLRFDDELSFDMIADRLGISEPAARMRVQRAIHNLRLLLEGLNCVELRRRRKTARRADPRRTASFAGRR